MAGNQYLVPAGTDISDGGGLFAGRVGDFVEGTYKQLYDIGQFLVSNLEGNISLMKSANFTYDDTTGAAIVVLDNTGAVFP